MILSDIRTLLPPPALEAAWPQVQKAMETDYLSWEPGRYPISGEDLFVVVQRYMTAPPQELPFETHDRYADVQLILSGKERILVCSRCALGAEKIPYDIDGDITFYEDPRIYPTQLDLGPGDYAIFMPEDAHKTRCIPCDGQTGPICKAIIKVKLY